VPLVVERGTLADVRPETRPYRPFGASLELFQCRAREVVIEGPADTGKSRACLEKLHAAATKYAGMAGAIVRKTRTSITESAQKTYERWVCPPGASRLWHDLEYRYPNGSTLVLAGLDEPTRLLSTEFDVVYVMQAEELSVDDWELLTTRVTGRGAVMPYVQLLGDMNPTDPGFFLYQREKAGATAFLKATHADNPTMTEDRLAPLKALTGYRRRRLYLGERVAAEGMFFPEWDPTVHVCDPFPIPAHWTRWTATDYGFAEPFAHYAAAREPGTKRICLFREIYAEGKRDADQATLITARIREERETLKVPEASSLYALHVGDPSMFNKRTEANLPSIAAVYRAGGVRLEPAGNNRKSGWSVVRAALAHGPEKPPRLQVFRGRCPNLERTLPAMVHDPLDPEDLADKIGHTKTEDHAVDALRYLLVAEASPPRVGTREVQVG